MSSQKYKGKVGHSLTSGTTVVIKHDKCRQSGLYAYTHKRLIKSVCEVNFARRPAERASADRLL